MTYLRTMFRFFTVFFFFHENHVHAHCVIYLCFSIPDDFSFNTKHRIVFQTFIRKNRWPVCPKKSISKYSTPFQLVMYSYFDIVNCFYNITGGDYRRVCFNSGVVRIINKLL